MNSDSIKNIKIPFPTEGIIRTAQLDDTVTPQNSAQIAVNMNFDRVGAIQTRLGVSNYGESFPVTVPLDILSMASLQTKGVPAEQISWGSSHQNVTTDLFNGSVIAIGQAFQVPTQCRLDNIQFYISKTGSPGGNIAVTIFAATGTYGTNAIPTGPILATSDLVPISTIGTSFAFQQFNFTIANRILLNPAVTYVAVLNYAGGDGSNFLAAGIDNTGAGPGNESFSSDLINWIPQTNDMIFSIYASSSLGTHRLFIQCGNTYLVWDQLTWTNLGSIGADTKARWAQFLNYIWRVNGTFNSPVQTSNGGSFGTDLVPADFPPADYISAGFEGRVWVADAVNDVIYYTDIVQFAPPDTYTLSFDINTNFIQNFSPQDGQTFTGLFRVPRALLVFKQNSIYRIYGATSVDAYPAYNVGTYSQESIVQAKDGLYFHHSSGFYQFNYDGQPTEISRRIIDFVQAIPLSKYSTIVGQWDQFDSISWAIGTVTVEGVTYRNCVVRYTISTQVWTIYDYAHKLINSMVVYNDGISVKKLIGTSSSSITSDVLGQLDTGFTDFNDSIYFEYIDRWRSFTDVYAKTQAISGVNLYSENAAGARVEYQIQKQPPNVWGDIGTVDQENMSLFPNASTDDFEVVRLRITGNSSGTPIVIHGIEILSINVKGYETN